MTSTTTTEANTTNGTNIMSETTKETDMTTVKNYLMQPTRKTKFITIFDLSLMLEDTTNRTQQSPICPKKVKVLKKSFKEIGMLIIPIEVAETTLREKFLSSGRHRVTALYELALEGFYTMDQLIECVYIEDVTPSMLYQLTLEGNGGRKTSKNEKLDNKNACELTSDDEKDLLSDIRKIVNLFEVTVKPRSITLTTAGEVSKFLKGMRLNANMDKATFDPIAMRYLKESEQPFVQFLRDQSGTSAPGCAPGWARSFKKFFAENFARKLSEEIETLNGGI
jgi:hypothetical protein